MVKFSQHKLTLYQVQIIHHQSLYLEHLPFVIKEKYKVTEGLSELEKELFIDTSLAWELGEIEMVGYVGLFHLWEKYSKDFLSTLFNKKFSEWPRLPRMIYPKKVEKHLSNFGINISEDILETIIEANTVVNAYKHGEEAIEKLEEDYPAYFGVAGNPDSFYIPSGKLEKLFDATLNFWKEVESQVELNFNFNYA